MSLRKNTSPSCPPTLPPLLPLNANTYAGIHLASAMSNSTSSQNGKDNNCTNVFFDALSEIDAAGGSKILTEHGPINQTNGAPLSPTLLFSTPLRGGRAAMRIAPVLKVPLGGWFYSIAFLPILPSFLPRHTRHNSAKPKSDHKPTTVPTKYLHQYLTDEDILIDHPLHMYGGQMPVPYGCTYLLLWGQRFMVNGKKWKKLPFYTNKISRSLRVFGQFWRMGYHFDPLIKPDAKYSLLFWFGSILGLFCTSKVWYLWLP